MDNTITIDDGAGVKVLIITRNIVTVERPPADRGRSQKTVVKLLNGHDVTVTDPTGQTWDRITGILRGQRT